MTTKPENLDMSGERVYKRPSDASIGRAFIEFSPDDGFFHGVMDRARYLDAGGMVPGDWLPIESAPKDGTEILVYVPPRNYDRGYIRSVQWRENDIDYWSVEDNKHGPFPLRGGSPTHWMPLPEPPA